MTILDVYEERGGVFFSFRLFFSFFVTIFAYSKSDYNILTLINLK